MKELLRPSSININCIAGFEVTQRVKKVIIACRFCALNLWISCRLSLISVILFYDYRSSMGLFIIKQKLVRLVYIVSLVQRVVICDYQERYTQ